MAKRKKVTSANADDGPIFIDPRQPQMARDTPVISANKYGDDFDEAAYIAQNPDVALAIANGEVPNALYHYRIYGRQEGRAASSPGEPALTGPGDRTKLAAPGSIFRKSSAQIPRASVEKIVMSQTGGIFVCGWTDDYAARICEIRIQWGKIDARFLESSLVRVRRRDAEASLKIQAPRSFGFFGLLAPNHTQLSQEAVPTSECTVTILFANGARWVAVEPILVIPDHGLLETALGYLANAEFCGNKAIESFSALDRGLGDVFVRYNRALSRGIVAAAASQHFGKVGPKPKASVIVCVYGRPEFVFLQNSNLLARPRADEYEFIYVCNSPELIEPLFKIARSSARIYGASQTMVMLPGNAGFGGANNAASKFAKSDRLIFMNPDVLSKDGNWAVRHAEIIAERPRSETDLFGSRLYYADGSLMHAGMYIVADHEVSVQAGEIRPCTMLRVEHFGKGASPDRFAESSVVPAVSGALISVARPLYERLGGFSDEFVFGHYEDADMCLRAFEDGTRTWVHDLALWHLEGKGSTRLPFHEGASMVNRWLFTKKWKEKISGAFERPWPADAAMENAVPRKKKNRDLRKVP